MIRARTPRSRAFRRSPFAIAAALAVHSCSVLAAPGDARGPEFPLHVFPSGGEVSLASDPFGGFVAVWSSPQDPAGPGLFDSAIRARRFSKTGSPKGDEIAVNTFTAGLQAAPCVAMDASGNFVVVWMSNQDEGSGFSGGYGIYAQRYDNAGARLGREFRVNTTTAGLQQDPVVAMDDSGNFVVAWSSYQQDGSNFGIYAQRYGATGKKRGAEFKVNSFTTGAQTVPAAAMDPDGDFVVSWASFDQDGDEWGVYAQRFDAAGAPQGGEFRVNEFTTRTQDRPAVAMASDGSFVVAWHSERDGGLGFDGGRYGVYARRFSAAGAAVAGEYRVNTFTREFQGNPALDLDVDGDLVVAWTSYEQDGDIAGVYAQRFDAQDTPQGDEFLVNTSTTEFQGLPAVALDASGDTIIAWEGEGASESGVFGRLFEGAGGDIEPTVAFTRIRSKGTEGSSTTVVVKLSAPSALTVKVPITVRGTAVRNTDYSLAAGKTLSIRPGKLSARLTIVSTGDGATEADEKVVMTLGTPVNATLGTIVKHTHTIVDND